MKKEVPPHLERVLMNLPRTPGVYQMKDISGKIIYVGKAKNLFSRVNSYFTTSANLSPAKHQMVEKVVDIEIILCTTEVEALILETNLIKHLSPKYNILMKDDKNLAYIKITSSPVPEILKTRQKISDNSEYFGPYMSNVEDSLRVIRRLFRIRNCSMKFTNRNNTLKITDKAGKTIPCMDHYIGLCPAPCLLKEENIKEHNQNIDSARQFLLGKNQKLFKSLEEDMHKKARLLEFEEAQKIKKTLESLRTFYEQQIVRDIVDGDIDVCVKYEKYEKKYIALTKVRSSRIIGVFRYEITHHFDDEDILVQFLMRQYLDTQDLPRILLLREEITDSIFLDFLSQKNIKEEYPKIGPKNDLLEFTYRQLRDYAYKQEFLNLQNTTLTRNHMIQILARLGYPYPKKGPIIFECYDISHTDGHFTYASRISIINGKPDTSRYRKYKIRNIQDGDIDDFAAHKEVMTRRTLEGIEQNNFPHLIIIDGGKGQLSHAILGIKEGIYLSGKKDYDHNSFPICSLAKKEEEVFLPGNSSPILFEKGTPELMILQKARDESHRFSVSANISARKKSMKKNILEDIPGIGPITRQKLLRISGNIEGIKDIPLEEIQKITTKSQLQILRDHGIY